ncbi:MAG TPA: CAP domain-containing protein [Actinomycetota bacterium]|nr:CAP domain-containing protein [Actinomycetota bacterium]
MKAARRSFTGALCSILFLTLLPATSANAACYKPTRAERSFVRKMNKARDAAGKAPLSLDREVSKVSKVHTKEMSNEDSLFHTSTSVLSKRVTNWILLGENVGVGGSVSSLHQAFMNSPAHKANILLGSFKYVGVGVIKTDDRMWVTVTFEAKSDPGSPLC